MENIYEKLGVFYLGKDYDIEKKKVGAVPTLLRSKDLTTHAVCLGMTGSGKTGLCISMLEEAAIDNIPVIAIDPKGDISNLMLGFENMSAAEFKPWLNAEEALQKGVTLEELAESTAEMWSEGIKSWDQTTERIKKIKNNVDMRIYTPGSSSGLELSLFEGFKAPTNLEPEDMADAIENTVTSYLSVVDKKSSKSGSPEHSFLSEILKIYWQKGESLNFPDFIGAILNPPFDKIGVLDLEAFFPKKDRSSLALKFNALYASPQYKTWSAGDPISIPKLLYGESGKPQISIVSIAHLEEKERIFFVSRLLSELVSWTRKQKGTSSLRALLYMDEIYGYFPPNENPPTKKPMLTLLKQARAQGVGVILATQNPVDLDYKGLSNTGTWFIGRLQTERDKARLLEGLKAIGGSSEIDWDKAISSLNKRVFLMHSVHQDAPKIFHSRWALSYLSGPIGQEQIAKLMEPYKKDRVEKLKEIKMQTTSNLYQGFNPNTLPKEVDQKIYERRDQEMYAPHFGAVASTFFKHRKSGEEREVQQVWTSPVVENDLNFEVQDFVKEDLYKIDPEEKNFKFSEVPSFARNEKAVKSVEKEIKNHIYRNAELNLWECVELKEFSDFGEDENEFRGKLSHLIREQKDEAVDKLNQKYQKKFEIIDKRILRATQKVELEKEQYSAKKTNTFLSIGTALASVLLGGKALSGASARRAGSVLRSATGASKERGDISRAEEQLKDYQTDMEDMREELEDSLLKIEEELTADNLELVQHKIGPTKTNIDLKWCGLIWK
jgi:DNA helicase HerA-like ATPase